MVFGGRCGDFLEGAVVICRRDGDLVGDDWFGGGYFGWSCG